MDAAKVFAKTRHKEQFPLQGKLDLFGKVRIIQNFYWEKCELKMNSVVIYLYFMFLGLSNISSPGLSCNVCVVTE